MLIEGGAGNPPKAADANGWYGPPPDELVHQPLADPQLALEIFGR
jgi:hypothetical protein